MSEPVREPKKITLACEAEMVEGPLEGTLRRVRRFRPCGRQAGWYRLSGDLASVCTRLCQLHAQMFRDRGQRVESIEAPGKAAPPKAPEVTR